MPAVVSSEGIYNWEHGGSAPAPSETGRVKFTRWPTHLHPRQYGLRVAPCSLHPLTLPRPPHREQEQWRQHEWKAHCPQTQGTVVFPGPARGARTAKRSPARDWMVGRWDFRAPLRAPPLPHPPGPRGHGLPVLCVPSSSSEAEQPPR